MQASMHGEINRLSRLMYLDVLSAMGVASACVTAVHWKSCWWVEIYRSGAEILYTSNNTVAKGP